MSEQLDLPPLPVPLVPVEVDLRDFQYMELDVRVLRDSRFAAQVSGDAFRAGVLLWCASWHQVPCASLPDDDIELANLAGFGRFHEEWRKIRDEALIGFVKCSDGRLYHGTVAEKAMSAWTARLHHHFDRARDRLRKLNKARGAEQKDPIPEITFERWNDLRLSAGIPMEKADAWSSIPPEPTGIPPANAHGGDGIPSENGLKGNGEGTERRGNGDLKKKKPGRAKSPELTLATWLETMRAAGQKPIPDGDPVFDYAKSIELPREFLAIAWRVFRSEYLEEKSDKVYRDWRAPFRTSVKRNWFKLWYLKEDQYQLTTVGLQAQRAHAEKQQEAA